MGERILEFDAYNDKSNDFAKPILTYVRDFVHDVCPSVEEQIKWGFPNYVYCDEILCSIAAHKTHCSFSFWKGKLMTDPKDIIKTIGKTSMGDLGKIKSVEDLPAKSVFSKYLKEAMKLNEQHVKDVIDVKAKPKKKHKAPKELLAAIKADDDAWKHWQSFSPSKQYDYISWIVEAKQMSTKEKRILTTVMQVGEGKSRHWKYKRK